MDEGKGIATKAAHLKPSHDARVLVYYYRQKDEERTTEDVCERLDEKDTVGIEKMRTLSEE